MAVMCHQVQVLSVALERQVGQTGESHRDRVWCRRVDLHLSVVPMHCRVRCDVAGIVDAHVGLVAVVVRCGLGSDCVVSGGRVRGRCAVFGSAGAGGHFVDRAGAAALVVVAMEVANEAGELVNLAIARGVTEQTTEVGAPGVGRRLMPDPLVDAPVAGDELGGIFADTGQGGGKQRVDYGLYRWVAFADEHLVCQEPSFGVL
jgi:hypothetical protein